MSIETSSSQQYCSLPVNQTRCYPDAYPRVVIVHRDWYAATPPKPSDGLQASLLAQEPRAAGGLLRVNFDPALLAFSEEVSPPPDPGVASPCSTCHGANDMPRYASAQKVNGRKHLSCHLNIAQAPARAMSLCGEILQACLVGRFISAVRRSLNLS